MQEHRLLEEIARRSFNGDIKEGLRRDFIFTYLKRAGLSPSIDEFGNVWIERGKKGEFRLFSSHMDVDPEIIEQAEIALRFNRNTYSGVLDNAVGCYLNLESAIRNTSDRRTLYVFTASEEEEPENPDNYARSARDVLKVLAKRGIAPSLCVAVDVTYPRILAKPEELDELWDEMTAEQLFDLRDPTHCYIDSLNDERSRAVAEQLAVQHGNPNIKTRELTGWDEASVYSQISPAFAFGPVVYGKFDEPNQRMPLRNLVTAQEFLKYLNESRRD